MITLARNNIFSIRKNFLIAVMLLYQKQSVQLRFFNNYVFPIVISDFGNF